MDHFRPFYYLDFFPIGVLKYSDLSLSRRERLLYGGRTAGGFPGVSRKTKWYTSLMYRMNPT